MALKTDQNYLPHVKRNAGVGKPNQIEFVARTSDPSDSDLADGRVYYNSSDKQFYGRLGGAFHGMTPGKQLVTSITATATLTEAQAGVILGNTSTDGYITLTLPAASSETGLTYTIIKSDSVANSLVITAGTGDGIDTSGLEGSFKTMDAEGDGCVLVADGSGTWFFAHRYIH